MENIESFTVEQLSEYLRYLRRFILATLAHQLIAAAS